MAHTKGPKGRSFNPRALASLPPLVRQYAEGGPVISDPSGILPRRLEYDRYVIETQSAGDIPLPFAEWLAQKPPMGGELPPEQQPLVDPIGDAALRVFRAMRKGSELFTGPPLPGEESARALRTYQAGGPIDLELFDPSYYRSDLIPQPTADQAAAMAMDRAVRRAMTAGTTSDARARLEQLIREIKARQLSGEMPPVGTRQELWQRLRPQFARGGQIIEHEMREPYEGPEEEMAEAMALHHVDPAETGGFTHETEDEMYTYQTGGQVSTAQMILRALQVQLSRSTDPLERESLMRQINDLRFGGLPLRMQRGGAVSAASHRFGREPTQFGGPGLFDIEEDQDMGYQGGGPIVAPFDPAALSAPTPPPQGELERSQGTLATLGEQLIRQRTALQDAYNIPPPADMPTPTPQLPPMGQTAVSEGLQNRLIPNFARGGPLRANVVRAAAQDPRLSLKMARR